MIKLGKMQRVTDLRKVWPNEARDFTSWLAESENLQELGNAIDMELELTEQESPVGSFSVDVFAQESGTTRKVVIENQLEATDHDHLGKLITYASGKDAQVIIWIVKHAREEHAQAIEWLNEHTDASVDFFLIEIELWKIGDSYIAPKFNIVERPNNWAKTQKVSPEVTGAKRQQLSFWQYFADNAFDSEDKFAGIFKRRKALPQHWYDLGAGSSSYCITLRFNTQAKTIQAGAYIKGDKDLFARFVESSNMFEDTVQADVEWREMKKDCQFLVSKEGCSIEDTERWPEYMNWLKDMAVKTKEFLKQVDKN